MSPPFHFNADDIAGLTVLLTRQIMAQDEKAAADAAKKAAETRLTDATALMGKTRAAFGAFGFDTSDAELWDQVKEAIGLEQWNLGISRARRRSLLDDAHPLPPAPPPPPPPPPPSDEDVESEEPKLEEPSSELPEKLPIRVLALQILTAAGKSGMLASEIRAAIESSQSIKLHDKTVGMTLYRLSRDHLVTRTGRTWFSVPPKAETENPGGDTPGSKDAQNGEEEA